MKRGKLILTGIMHRQGNQGYVGVRVDAKGGERTAGVGKEPGGEGRGVA